ncbi:hypothetical protein GOP47_0003670 [Adiantum capillus-veneris]|uniref:protein-L-isoaspartate(D-aspartate) O-methyltransferase n=1 Tax=Adiantum capillus-veneris TaxID=13818 RepID=A0A9D4V7Q9_ADICA|nr:hypothetical protein GOP47_0003670 [Adiantum capillus-veneris]
MFTRAAKSAKSVPSAERLAFLQRHRHPLFFSPRMEFFWAPSPNDNHSLVELLRQGGVIKSQRVAEAMEKIDRKLFVPDKAYAYMDNPMPIGYNATISAPHMHALCLQLLENHLQPGMHALDVGSGTGYLTSCFAIMVGKEGRVMGVEHIPQLVEQSIENVKASAAAPLLESGRLSFHVVDGRLGWPDEAPYDAIHVGAAASEVPDALLQQLKPGGRMVIPVGDEFQELRVIDKQSDGTLKEWCETSVRYVPLTSRNEQLRC